MKFTSLLTISLLFISASVSSKPLSEWIDDAQNRVVTEVLPNGLTVVCYPMPGTYNVHVGITYNVGGKDELPSECGMAHMVEHMIFKGTQKMSETDLKAIARQFCIGEIGVGYSAVTSHDLTRYYFNADKNSWPVFLDILADCMFNVRFDKNHLASEAKAIIEELNLRSSNPFLFMYDLHGTIMYPQNHPYHHPVGGYKEVILNTTSAELKEFYRRNYHPSKALLTIIGDITVSDALAAARKAFNVTCKTAAAKDREVQPVVDMSRKKVTAFKPIAKASYTLLWKLPKDIIIADYAECVAQILRQRLDKLLVDEKDLVLSVDVHAFQQQLGGIMACMYEPKKEGTVKQIKAVIREELNKLVNEGMTPLELARYQKSSEAEFLKIFAQSSSIASMLEMSFFPRRSTDDFFNNLKRIQAITLQNLKEFVKNYLRDSLTYSITCLPIPDDEKGRWESLKQQEEQYEQAILEKKIRETAMEPARYVHELPAVALARYEAIQPDKVVTLSNGLTVYLKKRDETPFVSAMLLFKDSEKFTITQGIDKQLMVSKFAMDLLSEGCAQFTKEQNHEFFGLLGAVARYAGSGLYINCVAQDFSRVAERCLLILKEPAYNGRILQQYAQSTVVQLKQLQNDPGYMASRLLDIELYKAYPWMIDDAEIMRQLNALTPEALFAFNKRYVNPHNMYLVLVGSIDLDTIVGELETVFASWKNDAEYCPLFEKEPVIPAIDATPGRILVHTLPVDQVYLFFGRVTNVYDSKDMLALKLLDSYMQHKLFEIREKTGIFYAFQARLNGQTIFQKNSALLVFPVSSANVESAQKAIQGVLTEIAQHGIPQEALELAQQQSQMNLLKYGTTNDSLLELFTNAFSHNETSDKFQRRLAGLQALTKADVDDVARRYLDPTGWTILKVGRVTPKDETETVVEVAELAEASSGGFMSWLFGG